MAHHNKTGILGENLAHAYLIQHDFLILHQNWRHSHWEIDFIASRKEVLHFIEIKTRRSQQFGHPEEGVTKKKMENLINASEVFLYLNPDWKRICFDVLSINLFHHQNPEYYFIEDVYLPNS